MADEMLGKPKTDRELLEDIALRLLKIEAEIGAISEIKALREFVDQYRRFAEQKVPRPNSGPPTGGQLL